MDPAAEKPSGTVRLFAFSGINVYVHWSWAVVGLLELQWRADVYDSLIWNAIEYVAIFVLVLLHEFGHALACRSGGGKAHKILLWPLGGVAYVQPPPRPGAVLWSIFAGPLVNILLLPVTIGAVFAVAAVAPDASTDLQHAVLAIAFINLVLLVFNLLPIYPLDGGQIVHALLWFVIGRERSLLVAASIGLVASVAGGLAAVLLLQDLWIGAIAVYAAWRSWVGLSVARRRMELLAAPRHEGRECPACKEPPVRGLLVRCAEGHSFDPFDTEGSCPQCGIVVDAMPCLLCAERSPMRAWRPSERPGPLS